MACPMSMEANVHTQVLKIPSGKDIQMNPKKVPYDKFPTLDPRTIAVLCIWVTLSKSGFIFKL